MTLTVWDRKTCEREIVKSLRWYLCRELSREGFLATCENACRAFEEDSKDEGEVQE